MSKFLGASNADEFYQEHRGKPFFSDLTAYMSSDVVTGMELVADNAIQKFRDVMGPTNSQEAKQTEPDTLRALYGSDGMRNGIHGSGTQSECSREMDLFFSKNFRPTAAFNNCTCCIIKPHIVREGLAG